MARSSGVRGGRWPALAVVAVLCGLALLGAIWMERRTLASSIQDQVAKAEGHADETIARTVVDMNLTKRLGDDSQAKVGRALEDGVLGGNVVRVRLYATDGGLIFSTDERDRYGTIPGDRDAIRGAAADATTGIVGDDRVSIEGGDPQSFRLLQSYVPVMGPGDEPVAVAQIDAKARGLEAGSQQPWRTIQLGAGILAVLFLELALFGFARSTAAKRLAARSGFQKPSDAPQQDAVKDEESLAKQAQKEERALDRERAARRALEDQLETLRTQLRQQDEQIAFATRELSEQLDAMTLRAKEAEERLQLSGASAVGTSFEELSGRLEETERRLQDAEMHAQQAEARAQEMEIRVAESPDLADALQRAMQDVALAEGRVVELEMRLAEMAVAVDSAERGADHGQTEARIDPDLEYPTRYAEMEVPSGSAPFDHVLPVADDGSSSPSWLDAPGYDPAPPEETMDVADEPAAEGEDSAVLAEREDADETGSEVETASEVETEEANGPEAVQSVVEEALGHQVQVIREAGEGERDEALLQGAEALFEHVRSGALAGSEVADALVAAALQAGMSEIDARRAIASAFSMRRSA